MFQRLDTRRPAWQHPCTKSMALLHQELSMTLLGDVLKQSRESHSWPVRELSRRADVSHTQIGRIESGAITAPSRETLIALCRALQRNPRPLMVLAHHLDTDAARNELAPMFREHAELL